MRVQRTTVLRSIRKRSEKKRRVITLFKIDEEFDPGSERTLVECLIHASRASRSSNALGERRTGE